MLVGDVVAVATAVGGSGGHVPSLVAAAVSVLSGRRPVCGSSSGAGCDGEQVFRLCASEASQNLKPAHQTSMGWSIRLLRKSVRIHSGLSFLLISSHSTRR